VLTVPPPGWSFVSQNNTFVLVKHHKDYDAFVLLQILRKRNPEQRAVVVIDPEPTWINDIPTDLHVKRYQLLGRSVVYIRARSVNQLEDLL